MKLTSLFTSFHILFVCSHLTSTIYINKFVFVIIIFRLSTWKLTPCQGLSVFNDRNRTQSLSIWVHIIETFFFSFLSSCRWSPCTKIGENGTEYCDDHFPSYCRILAIDHGERW